MATMATMGALSLCYALAFPVVLFIILAFAALQC